MTRIGTYALQEQLVSYMRINQSRFADLQTQLATGDKSRTYSGLGSVVPRLLNMEDVQSRLDRYIDNIELAEQRASMGDLALSRMEEIAREMKRFLELSPKDYQTHADVARNYFREFADTLNIKDATRALFGGTNTTGPAVQIYAPGTPDPAAPFAGVAGGNSYRYKILATGAATDTTVKISDTQSVSSQINANPAAPATANAFTKVLDALIRVANFNTAITPAPAQADVDSALADLRDALNGNTGTGISSFDTLRGQMATTRTTVSNVKDSHQRLRSYAMEVTGNIEKADMAEVAAKLKSQQVQLETSYAALARVDATSLLDFLR